MYDSLPSSLRMHRAPTTAIRTLSRKKTYEASGFPDADLALHLHEGIPFKLGRGINGKHLTLKARQIFVWQAMVSDLEGKGARPDVIGVRLESRCVKLGSLLGSGLIEADGKEGARSPRQANSKARLRFRGVNGSIVARDDQLLAVVGGRWRRRALRVSWAASV